MVAELREPLEREHTDEAAAEALRRQRIHAGAAATTCSRGAAPLAGGNRGMGGERYELRVMPSCAGVHELARLARRNDSFAPSGLAALAEARSWTCDVLPSGRPAFAMSAPPRYPVRAW